jgi:hypothetical protein
MRIRTHKLVLQALFDTLRADPELTSKQCHGEASENLQNALDVEYGTNSTYKHAHMPKTNSSPVKILLQSSCKKFSQSSHNSVSESTQNYP